MPLRSLPARRRRRCRSTAISAARPRSSGGRRSKADAKGRGRVKDTPPPALALPAAAARSSVLRGILLMCLGVAMFPFLNAAAKLLTQHYPVPEIVWARFTGHLVWVVILFFPRRGWRLFLAHKPLVQIARSFLLFG